MHFGGGLWMIFFWIIVIALLVWALTSLTSGKDSGKDREKALDIARERYAKGEITKEAFEQIKKDLM